jgi:hypothetical protein
VGPDRSASLTYNYQLVTPLGGVGFFGSGNGPTTIDR